MMPLLFKKALAICCFAAIFQGSKAQDIITDTGFTSTALANNVALYHQYTGHQSRLYNGLEHTGYSHLIVGHAYFLSNDWHKGSVLYDGILYQDVTMQYDLFKDELVIRHYNQFIRIALHSEKVQSFTIDNHSYIRDSIAGSPFPAGFYEKIYEGKTSLLVKRKKIVEETITDHVERTFIQQNFYFINRQGMYYGVKSFRGLLKVFKDKSKEVRQYLRKNKIKFRKDRELAIMRATAHYDATND